MFPRTNTIKLLLVVFANAVDWRAQADPGISDIYPNCQVSDLSLIGDGICDFGDYNSEKCGFDGGDCDRFNQIVTDYPQCKARDILRIGDGQCDTDEEYNNEDCGYDGGDCAHPEYPNCFHWYKDPKGYVNNNQCDIDFNNEACGFDGGDCDFINEKGYPKCAINSDETEFGDGICHEKFNFEECGHDDGDCDEFNEKYPNCIYIDPARLGDGVCDAGSSNYFTKECGFDDGDCADLVAILEKYPNCESSLGNRFYLSYLGDGECYSEVNFEECGFDAGDCNDFNLNYPHCDVAKPYRINNGWCDTAYNNEECKFDGGDCDDFNARGYVNCKAYNAHIVLGDGICDGYDYNTEECGWDDGDCDEFNKRYPGCKSPESWIGDGYCTLRFNTEECGYDGGDCEDENKRLNGLKEKYPNCDEELIRTYNFADGNCDFYSPTHIEECGWDGGDCDVEGYPDCFTAFPFLIGNGVCDIDEFGQREGQSLFNSQECGYDGGDCIAFNKYFNATYPECKVPIPQAVGNGYCDDWPYSTEECGYDGGDCFSGGSLPFSSFAFLLSIFAVFLSLFIIG